MSGSKAVTPNDNEQAEDTQLLIRNDSRLELVVDPKTTRHMYAKPISSLEHTPTKVGSEEKSPSVPTQNGSESKQAYQEYFGRPAIHSGIQYKKGTNQHRRIMSQRQPVAIKSGD